MELNGKDSITIVIALSVENETQFRSMESYRALRIHKKLSGRSKESDSTSIIPILERNTFWNLKG